MNAKVESGEFRFDALKWLVVVLLVLGSAIANSQYSLEFPLLYRFLALVGVGIVVLLVAANTAKGSAFWSLLKAAQIEIKKVIWPTRQETVQTTMIVIAVVIVAGAILWALDAGFGYLVSRVIG